MDSTRHAQEEGWCWLEGAEVVAQALYANGFFHGQQRIHTLIAAQYGKPKNAPLFCVSHCSAVASAYPLLPLPSSTGRSFCGSRKRMNSVPITENSAKIKDCSWVAWSAKGENTKVKEDGFIDNCMT